MKFYENKHPKFIDVSIVDQITQAFMPPVVSPYAFLTFESEDSVSRVFRFGESHRVFGGYVSYASVSDGIIEYVLFHTGGR